MKRKCGFEQREALGKKYWDDPRWKKVEKLREQNKNGQANMLVGVIRKDWGVEV